MVNTHDNNRHIDQLTAMVKAHGIEYTLQTLGAALSAMADDVCESDPDTADALDDRVAIILGTIEQINRR